MEKRQKGKIILITGGARSGKSAFAEHLAAENGKNVAYIATSQIFDEEMKFRVRLHRQRRPADWQTYEAPFEAHHAIAEAAARHDMILFDCITLYLSNILCQMKAAELADQEAVYQLTRQRIGGLVTAAQRAANGGTSTIFVTNEVGAGIVPENRLSRIYRDISGLANQQIARESAEVYAVIAGIPVNIKALA